MQRYIGISNNKFNLIFENLLPGPIFTVGLYPHTGDYYLSSFRYVHDPALNYNQILVPTIDTTRTTWLLNMMMKIKRPVVLVGETGTSKTATIQVRWLIFLDIRHAVM